MAAGDRGALAALYERHASLLLGLALKIVRERREAEDLLHDVFLEAWRSAKDFDPKRGRVRTWLAIRMRSRALDLQKSARVSRNAGDAGLEVVPDEREAVSPDHGRVRAALADLVDGRHGASTLVGFSTTVAKQSVVATTATAARRIHRARDARSRRATTDSHDEHRADQLGCRRTGLSRIATHLAGFVLLDRRSMDVALKFISANAQIVIRRNAFASKIMSSP